MDRGTPKRPYTPTSTETNPMPSKTLWETFFGGDNEHHKDGSSTERFESGDTITRDPEGDVLTTTTRETRWFGPDEVVTRDGDGNTLKTDTCR
jgi:hypothetical protein